LWALLVAAKGKGRANHRSGLPGVTQSLSNGEILSSIDAGGASEDDSFLSDLSKSERRKVLARLAHKHVLTWTDLDSLPIGTSGFGPVAVGHVLELEIQEIDIHRGRPNVRLVEGKDTLGTIRRVAFYTSAPPQSDHFSVGNIMRWKHPRARVFLDGVKGARLGDRDMKNVSFGTSGLSTIQQVCLAIVCVLVAMGFAWKQNQPKNKSADGLATKRNTAKKTKAQKQKHKKKTQKHRSGQSKKKDDEEDKAVLIHVFVDFSNINLSAQHGLGKKSVRMKAQIEWMKLLDVVEGDRQLHEGWVVGT
jgi:hypothetical protein